MRKTLALAAVAALSLGAAACGDDDDPVDEIDPTEEDNGGDDDDDMDVTVPDVTTPTS